MKKIIILLLIGGVLIFAFASKGLVYALGFNGNSLNQIQQYRRGGMWSRDNGYQSYNKSYNDNWRVNNCIDNNSWGW